jgi:hypothetical protein
MTNNMLWVHCEAEGCSSLFAPSKGKRYCSGACRAKASDEAQSRRRACASGARDDTGAQGAAVGGDVVGGETVTLALRCLKGTK